MAHLLHSSLLKTEDMSQIEANLNAIEQITETGCWSQSRGVLVRGTLLFGVFIYDLV